MTNFLLYCTAVMIWGSTWFAISFQLGDVSPEVSLVYRFGLAAAMLFCWCLARGRPAMCTSWDWEYCCSD